MWLMVYRYCYILAASNNIFQILTITDLVVNEGSGYIFYCQKITITLLADLRVDDSFS